MCIWQENWSRSNVSCIYVYFGRYLQVSPIIPSRLDSQNVLILIVENLLMQDTHLRFCVKNSHRLSYNPMCPDLSGVLLCKLGYVAAYFFLYNVSFSVSWELIKSGTWSYLLRKPTAEITWPTNKFLNTQEITQGKVWQHIVLQDFKCYGGVKDFIESDNRLKPKHCSW